MFNLELSWKEFNVNLEVMTDFAKSLDENCVGGSADVNFRLHFTSDPSAETIEAIQDKWDSLDEESAEVASYKSMEQIEADRQDKRASAKAKLTALGLTAEEVAAILG